MRKRVETGKTHTPSAAVRDKEKLMNAHEPKIVYCDHETITFLNAPTVAMIPMLSVNTQMTLRRISNFFSTGYRAR